MEISKETWVRLWEREANWLAKCKELADVGIDTTVMLDGLDDEMLEDLFYAETGLPRGDAITCEANGQEYAESWYEWFLDWLFEGDRMTAEEAWDMIDGFENKETTDNP